ncbi:MAG: peptidogalycan biosysnthesis protein, partial [Pseudomonadota bacterium]
MEKQQNIHIQCSQSLNGVDAHMWDRLVPDGHPFLRYDFLNALQETGCVDAKTGWQSNHYLAWQKNDKNLKNELIGAMVCWVKWHPYGEYNFDHLFADAWHHMGGQYYPKMLAAIPFTPVTGPRLLAIGDDKRRLQIFSKLLQTACDQLLEQNLSSLHINFCLQREQDFLHQQGFLIRKMHQYHWINNNYQTFDDFLGELTSRKRKQILKERASVKAQAIKHRWFTGSQMDQKKWDQFYQFYASTYDRKWGVPYLNRDFFTHISQKMGDRIRIVMGYDHEGFISGALNFISDHVLYGRNWGCRRQI